MDEQLNAREQGDIKHNEGAANPGGNGFGSHGEARPVGRIECIKTWTSNHRRESLAIMGLLAVLLVLLGLTLGWFVDANRGFTVGKIKEPAELKVLGPNATAAEQIDLSYNPEYGDTKTGNTVTLKRPFCVQTGGDGFELQLANTTNIKGLTIELYKAENPGLGDTPDVSGTAGGKPYSCKMSETDLLKSFTPINDPGDGLEPCRARAQATLHSRTIKTSSATRARSTVSRCSAKANSTPRHSTARTARTRSTLSSSFRGTRAPKRPM